MPEEFDFSKWTEGNGLTKKTVDTLKDQDLHVPEALALLTTSDIAELSLTKGQTRLLEKAVLLFQQKEEPQSKGLPSAPITTTSLAKNQGLEELIQKLDDGGGLDALVACGDSIHTYIRVHRLREIPNPPGLTLTHMSTSGSQVQVTKKEDKPLLIPDFIDVDTGIA